MSEEQKYADTIGMLDIDNNIFVRKAYEYWIRHDGSFLSLVDILYHQEYQKANNTKQHWAFIFNEAKQQTKGEPHD